MNVYNLGFNNRYKVVSGFFSVGSVYISLKE